MLEIMSGYGLSGKVGLSACCVPRLGYRAHCFRWGMSTNQLYWQHYCQDSICVWVSERAESNSYKTDAACLLGRSHKQKHIYTAGLNKLFVLFVKIALTQPNCTFHVSFTLIMVWGVHTQIAFSIVKCRYASTRQLFFNEWTIWKLL